MLKFCAGKMLNQMSIARTVDHIEKLKEWRDSAPVDYKRRFRQRDVDNEVRLLNKIRSAE